MTDMRCRGEVPSPGMDSGFHWNDVTTLTLTLSLRREREEKI
jgi:hypothetical protein